MLERDSDCSIQDGIAQIDSPVHTQYDGRIINCIGG
jgi:hypothetical protein